MCVPGTTAAILAGARAERGCLCVIMLRIVCLCARGEEAAVVVVASGALLRALCVCVCVGGRYVCCWLASVVRADGGFVYGPGRLAACLSQSQGQGQESGGDRDHSTTR